MNVNQLTRLRLESFIGSRYGRYVATTQQLPSAIPHETLLVLASFSCLVVERADPNGPLVVGLRETAGPLTSLYEVVEWRAPGYLERSRWHFSVQRGWRRLAA